MKYSVSTLHAITPYTTWYATVAFMNERIYHTTLNRDEIRSCYLVWLARSMPLPTNMASVQSTYFSSKRNDPWGHLQITTTRMQDITSIMLLRPQTVEATVMIRLPTSCSARGQTGQEAINRLLWCSIAVDSQVRKHASCAGYFPHGMASRGQGIAIVPDISHPHRGHFARSGAAKQATEHIDKGTRTGRGTQKYDGVNKSPTRTA